MFPGGVSVRKKGHWHFCDALSAKGLAEVTVKRPRAFGYSIPALHYNRQLFRRGKWWTISGVVSVIWLVLMGAVYPLQADTRKGISTRVKSNPTEEPAHEGAGLSPYWGPEIQQADDYIVALSGVYGFHPDFIAALISQESSEEAQFAGDGQSTSIIRIGSFTSGLDRQTNSQDIGAPVNNLEWGMAILSHVVQETGGDLFTALAAYKSGWNWVNNATPREFATHVLENYARALIVRSGLPSDSAANWTIAVEMRAGNVPIDSILVLGNKPYVGLRTFAAHTVYAHTDQDGNMYYVRGYVVPLGFAEIDAAGLESSQTQQLEAPLRARLGDKNARISSGNPRVLLACLPSLERLRGKMTTRWYSPSTCPEPRR